MHLFTTLLVVGGLTFAMPDTLQPVTIVADRGAIIPRADTLKADRFQTITELLMQNPGGYVSDNGGYAGLKTLSFRGMGSPHTAIYLDGVRIGNVQSGQSDIGSLALANFSSAVNPRLEAEDGWLTDVGIDWRKRTGRWSIIAKLDGFFNFLQNKITSAPSPDDPNIWQPYNVGRLRSSGVDILTGAGYARLEHLGPSSGKSLRSGRRRHPCA